MAPTEGRSLGRRLLAHGASLLLAITAVAMAVGLWWFPEQYTNNVFMEMQQRYNDQHFSDGQRVERHWMDFPYLAAFQQGDEPAIQAFLAQQPLIAAVFDRKDLRRAWLREGPRLVAAPETLQLDLYRSWITQAEAAQRFQWTPSVSENPETGRIASTILLGARYILVKRWEPGSPRVEEALRTIFGDRAPSRIGLHFVASSTAVPASLPRQPWGKEPHYQADPARLNNAPISFSGTSDLFGEGWALTVIPWSQEFKQLQKEYLAKEWMARGVAVGLVLACLTGLALRHRARRREALDMDRLASLTHSLKTPLAILKFRCDSIRLGRLGRDQTDAELIKVGEEVDHLTLMIQNGLEAIHGVSEAGPQGEVSAAWLSDLVDDLAPVFEAEKRKLNLNLTSDSGRAALPSLRSALLTLLENALFHGGGDVTLQTVKLRRRLQIRVQDAGEGLQPHQLEALGKPFMRIRNQGKEGFEHEGQGLGLSLLVQVAQKEGWGLTFASAPGEGFAATIEIRAF